VDASATLRTLDAGRGLYVVTLRGDADGPAAAALAGALGSRHSGTIIVDLLDARHVGEEVHEALGYARVPVTVVAQPRVLHALELSERAVRLELSLSAAVAAGV
jgi:hypothetical protein